MVVKEKNLGGQESEEIYAQKMPFCHILSNFNTFFTGGKLGERKYFG